MSIDPDNPPTTFDGHMTNRNGRPFLTLEEAIGALMVAAAIVLMFL